MKLNLKIFRRLNILVSSGISGFYFYNNAYCLEDIKKALELKIDSSSAPIAPKIKSLVREVMSEMGLTNEEKSLIQVFISNDCNLKHLGYLDKKFGAFVGVPQHFVLDKMVDFVVVPMIDSSLESSEMWNFKNCLTLSKEAKKFAVATEIYEAKHNSFYYQGLLPIFVFLQGNLLSFLFEKLFKSVGKQLPFHASLFLLAPWFYILLTDLITIYRQGEALYLAARLGPSYLEGGIEYYEKILERNKAIRKVDKSTPYSEKGELKKYLGFRTYTMPFEKRIMLLKEMKRDYKFSEINQNPQKYTL